MTPNAPEKSTIRPPWVLVSGGFHEKSGQDKPNAALVDYLLEIGNPVHLVAHGFAKRFLDHPLCSIYQVPRPFGVDLLGIYKLRSIGRKIARSIRASDPGTRVLVNGGCCCWDDINWVHFVHSAWRPSLSGVPLITRVKEEIAGRIFRRQEGQAFRAARLIVADSHRTRDAAIRFAGVDPAKARTVYYGAETTWTPPSAEDRTAARAWLGVSQDRPLAIFVGGFGYDERKGFDVLYKCWSELCRDSSWDVDLIAAGAGRTLEPWRRRVMAAGLDQRMRLIGFTDRVFDVLAAADVLVSPVRYEPYGLNVQEAICRGVPAIVSSRAGVVEQFPPELSEMILPDPEDTADLVCRFRNWRKDIDSWRKRFEPLSTELRLRSFRDMAAEIVALVDEGCG